MAKLCQRRIHVDKFDKRIGLFTDMLLTWHADHQRHASSNLPIGALIPSAMLAKLIAMVTPQDDDRIFAKPKAIELAHHFPDLGVGVTDTRKVTVNGFALFVLGNRAFLGNAFITAKFTGLVARKCRRTFGQLLKRSQMNIGVLIHIVVFL